MYEFLKEIKREPGEINTPAIHLDNGFILSIQASEYHYCEPRMRYISFGDYTSFEIVCYKDGKTFDLSKIDQCFKSFETVNYYGSPYHYGYVYISLVELLYKELKKINREKLLNFINYKKIPPPLINLKLDLLEQR